MHIHDFLYDMYLKQQNNSILLGMHISTFQQILNKDITTNHLVEFYHVYNQIQALELSKLQTMITYPKFVEELLSAYQEFIKYGVTTNELPNDTSVEKEIKIIFELFDSLHLSIHKKIKSLQHFNTQDYHAIYDYSSSIFEKECYQKWNVKKLSLPWIEKPNVSLYKAQNYRQEIEAILQYIMNHNIPVEDVQFVLLDTNYFHYLQQASKRYGIPINGQHFTLPSLFIQKLVMALECIQTFDCSSFIKLCNHNFFKVDTTALVNYLKQQPLEPTMLLQPLSKIQNLTNEYFRIEHLQQLEQEAEQIRLELLQMIELFVSDISTTEKVSKAFEYLLDDEILEDEEEDKMYQQAKECLETLLSVQAPLPILIYQLKKLQKSYPEVTTNAIMVSTLDTALPNYPLSIVIGCSQNNFPALKEYTGIIDEHYLAKVKKFPSKSNRALHYYQQADKLYHLSHDIIYSFSCANLQGKAFELSIEMEQRFGKEAQEWPLIQLHHEMRLKHEMHASKAKKLFLNYKKQLSGSVSSFERYQNCNYAYFIERGLKVRELESFTMDHRIMGTLQHAIVETFVGQNRLITKEELSSYLQPIFDSLLPLFPQREDYVLTLKEQTIERFTQRLQDIYDSIQGGIMQPSHFEYEVQALIDVKPYPVSLRGIIDRIDTSEEYLRIVDYKSSSKELKDGHFEEGLQLQLLTYLMVASEILKKRPYGAYYQSVKIENTDVPLYGPKDKATKTRPPMNEVLLQEEYIKNNAAKGWRVEDINLEEFAQTKYFDYKDKNFDELKAILLSKYQEIVENITSGKIAPNPTENTCEYCPYIAICRYHGETRKISKKGGKKDAEME